MAHKNIKGSLAIIQNALDEAYAQLNAIRARDGVPHTHEGVPSCITEDHFNDIVDQVKVALHKINEIEMAIPARLEAHGKQGIAIDDLQRDYILVPRSEVSENLQDALNWLQLPDPKCEITTQHATEKLYQAAALLAENTEN
jgi:hypothetical protein